MTAIVISNAGGNWNSTASWSPAQVPVAGDTVTATASSGNLTVTANAACASLDFTNYVGTFTINGSIVLTLTSTLKFVSGMTLVAASGTATITLNGTLTMTSGGKAWQGSLNLQGANTYTLGDDWTVGGLIAPSSTLNFGSGSSNVVVNGHTINVAGGNFNGLTSGSITGTTLINITSAISTTTWTSGGGTINNNLTIAAGANTFTVSGSVKYGTGTLSYTSGTTTGASTPSLNLQSSCTLVLGTGWAATVTIVVAAAATITWSGTNTLPATHTFTLPNAALTFAGSDFTLGILNNSALSGGPKTYTITAGQKMTVSGQFATSGTTTTTSSANFVSTTPGSGHYKIVIPSGAFSLAIFTNFTDCDASLVLTLVSFNCLATRCFNVATNYPANTSSNNMAGAPILATM